MTSYRSNFISCDFDFDAEGKHYGSAHLDYSDDEGVSRIFPIPIVSINKGDGPTLLLTAGNHGNEDEGQLILRRLIDEIAPENIQGRIIALPALNYPAVRANGDRCVHWERITVACRTGHRCIRRCRWASLFCPKIMGRLVQFV